MITAICWVPRGKPKLVPVRYVDQEDELPELSHSEYGRNDIDLKSKKGNQELTKDRNESDSDLSEEDEMVRDRPGQSVDDKYHLEDYDKDDTDIMDFVNPQPVFASNKEDPNLDQTKGDEESEEMDDFLLRNTDCLLLTACTEEDLSHVDVRVFEPEDNNVYIHHDYIMPTMPLCLEWINVNCGPNTGSGNMTNMVAVGSFAPHIEIWDLDVVDGPDPSFVLGDSQISLEDREEQLLRQMDFEAVDELEKEAVLKALKDKKKKKRKQAKKKAMTGAYMGHYDAVLSLSWNKGVRSVLASGSADKTVKLWDLSTLKCVQTFTHHRDKVQSVCWNPQENNVLLTGGYDRHIHMLDVRSSTSGIAIWSQPADIENIQWDPHEPFTFVTTLEDGSISIHDARKLEETLFRVEGAHGRPVSCLSIHPSVAGLIATGSLDKVVKLWDRRGDALKCVWQQSLKIGELFCASFCADVPAVLACGGRKEIKLLNLSNSCDDIWKSFLQSG